MKTKEELNALKKEVETLNNKLKELTDEELKQVTGGEYQPPVYRPGKIPYRITYENPEAYISLCICPYCGRDFGRSDLEYFHEPECPQNPANIK